MQANSGRIDVPQKKQHERGIVLDLLCWRKLLFDRLCRSIPLVPSSSALCVLGHFRLCRRQEVTSYHENFGRQTRLAAQSQAKSNTAT